MQVVPGRIINYDEKAGGFTVFVPYTDAVRMCRRQYEQVQVALSDGRKASIDQIKKAWCLIEEIAWWAGYDKSEMHDLMIDKFVHANITDFKEQKFQLRSADMTSARQFISYLIRFMVQYEVPSRKPLAELCEDIQNYIYSCFMARRCAVCGAFADLHHVDVVGMGNNRDEICHQGMRVITICRVHHTQAHMMGNTEFMNKYHVQPIVLTADMIKRAKKKGFYGFNTSSTKEATAVG